MTERWQRELSKLRRAELPGDLWDRVQEGPRLEPDRPPRARRLVAAAAALAMFAAGGILVWNAFRPTGPEQNALAGPAVIAVPPRGDVSPVFLSDGHPVWVVHHEEGGVSVLDGFSTHRPWGLQELVGWCPGSQVFIEPAHAPRWDDHGSYVTGPAPTGLATFRFEVLATDDEREPRTIRIGSMLPGAARGSHPVNDTIGDRCEPDGFHFVGLRSHRIPPEAIWASPPALAAAAPRGWAAVRGTLVIESDGLARLCTRIIAERCERGVVVRGIDEAGFVGRRVLIPEGRNPYAAAPLWLARVRDGLIDDLTLPVPLQTTQS